MKTRTAIVLSCSLAVLSAPALAADSHVPSTLAIETKAPPGKRGELHAAKQEAQDQRLELGRATTPLGASSKVGGARAPFVAEADVPITAAIETKAPRDQRAALHAVKQQWAQQRALLNQAWSPAQKAQPQAFRQGV